MAVNDNTRELVQAEAAALKALDEGDEQLAEEEISDEEIIELSGIVPDRPKGRIRTMEDGAEKVTEITLRVPQEFGAAALHGLRLELEAADALYTKKTKLDPTEEKQIERRFNQLAGRLIVGATPAEIATLPIQQRRGIGIRFFAEDASLLSSVLGTDMILRMAERLSEQGS